MRAKRRKEKPRKEATQHCQEKWEGEYDDSINGLFYHEYWLYSTKQPNTLRTFLSRSPRAELSTLVQLRTGHGAFGSFFRRFNSSTRPHSCRCGADKTVERTLRDCPVTTQKRMVLREASDELDLSTLLDTKKGLKAVAAFLALHLCTRRSAPIKELASMGFSRKPGGSSCKAFLYSLAPAVGNPARQSVMISITSKELVPGQQVEQS